MVVAGRVMLVMGTRPEAVKLAPVATQLGFHPRLGLDVVVTGQHSEMLEGALHAFDIVPNHDLGLHRPGQDLTDITVGCLDGLARVLAERSPAMVVVQGDTTSSFTAALAAFYAGIPVGHVEAGLRTGHRQAPWPEEVNRCLIARLAELHLAPTPRARANLLAEGIASDSIVITGNTVIDALLETIRRPLSPGEPGKALLDKLEGEQGRQIVVVTVHRRESWGAPLEGIAAALGDLARSEPQALFVVPLHPNPAVRDPLCAALTDSVNVVLTEPLPYPAFVHLLVQASFVVTDSGGIQEEAPSLGRPVLVLRDTTERPEALAAGTVRLLGTQPNRIVDGVRALLHDKSAYEGMARAVNPYGDGRAAERVVAAVAHHLGLGKPPEEFSPSDNN